MNISSHTLFSLLRAALVNEAVGALPSDIDWQEVIDLSFEQGVAAIAVDGFGSTGSPTENEGLGALDSPELEDLKYEWFGSVFQAEEDYKKYVEDIASLAKAYSEAGIEMMVLKGYGLSLNYPVPAHRPVGDVDIYLNDDDNDDDDPSTNSGQARLPVWWRGDEVIRKSGIAIDYSHHHHSVFYWGEFMVENHYDFINVHGRKANAQIEKIYKELGQDDSHFVEVEGERVYLPSPNLHTLFLMTHLVSHFVGANLNLRQVLDWGLFVVKHGKDVDWEWLDGVLEEFGMKEFYNIINAICVEDLGFDASLFHEVRFNPQTKEKVFSDILCPAFEADAPSSFLPRDIYKYKRWNGNGWKYELCYKESRWESFWTLLKSHLMKPMI